MTTAGRRVVLAAVVLPALAIPASAQAQAKSCFGVDPDEPDAPVCDYASTGEASATTVRKGQTVTFTYTFQNVGTGYYPSAGVEMRSSRVDGEKAVSNPYRSISTTQGTCRDPGFIGGIQGRVCEFGRLDPGQSVQVVAVVEVNESMDHTSTALFDGDDSNRANNTGCCHTVAVEAPPEVTGSNKIKIGGLPDSCVANDFTLRAKAKGAKKISATLRGPLNAEGKSPAGEFAKTEKLGSAKGAKLSAPVDADKLDATLPVGGAAYYEIKLAAKYDGKPKQNAAVFFQRC